MTAFKLPRGYSFTPPPDEAQSILVDDRGLYGGADISDHYDAIRTHYVLCCATGPGDPAFRLRGFACPAGQTKYKEVALAIEPAGMIVTGRGNQDIQWIDGMLHFSGWRDKEFFTGTIPSFQPFPSIPSLEARIAALEARLAQPVTTSLTGVYQGEPNSIEVGEGVNPHAFVDVKADSTVDFGARLINYADGHSELGHVGSGPLLIVVNGVVRLRLD